MYIIPPSTSELINIQLTSLRINPPILSQCSALNLPNDQLHVLSAIKNILGPKTQRNKYPYFFIIGPGGTGKSFIINLIVNDLKNKRSKYLLLAPTGVMSQNIGGQTIHSALRIRKMQNGFQTLAFHDYEFFKNLQQIDTLIIDEISMVSAALLIGDLAQLPPVTGLPVYKLSE
ncbi:AAA family ATPase [Rhizophagus clarus]|uniref:ATP-dependent DNA helicase n=1 Tax=Rhizophagus clarus TaxID=94130 RepID=A0A8H3MA68_9GLOM|nr:AAA family ATPase [Rhizophagus clarus]